MSNALTQACSAVDSIPVSSRARKREFWGALVAWGSLFLCLSLLVAASLMITPEALLERHSAWIPACPTRALFGRECPTCGMTRAFCALGHGRIKEAIRYNRFSPLAYTYVVVFALVGAAQTLRTLRSHRCAEARRIA